MYKIIPQMWKWKSLVCCLALKVYCEHRERLSSSARAVYNMGQCCKITGFPQCFLLFMRVSMATLERLHVGGSRAFPAEPTQLRNL